MAVVRDTAAEARRTSTKDAAAARGRVIVAGDREGRGQVDTGGGGRWRAVRSGIGGRAGFLLMGVAGREARGPVAAYITAASCSGARFLLFEMMKPRTTTQCYFGDEKKLKIGLSRVPEIRPGAGNRPMQSWSLLKS